MSRPPSNSALSPRGRQLALAAAFLGWLFAGVQMALIPLTSRAAAFDLLFGHSLPADAPLPSADETRLGQWFARYIAGYLLGAAFGGLLFGWLGDRAGRARAMGLSILTFSVLTGVSAFARSPEQLLVLRFLASLGVGGMWPNGVALVSEAWPDTSRPTLAGLIGMAANVGILAVGLLARAFEVTADTWRTAVLLGGTPVVLGIAVLALVPESPRWLAERTTGTSAASTPVREVFRPPLLGRTLLGICLGAVPLLGAWGSGKWLLPWAEREATDPTVKADTQWVWALGAVIGSAAGGWLASQLGRRLTYFLVSLGALFLNLGVYRFLHPTAEGFLPAVFVLGLVGTVFFGWLPLYLPELFPTRVRATGAGVTFNFGRFASAAGVLAAVPLMAHFEGDYARVGEATAWVYAVGALVILLAPDTHPSRNHLNQ